MKRTKSFRVILFTILLCLFTTALILVQQLFPGNWIALSGLSLLMIASAVILFMKADSERQKTALALEALQQSTETHYGEHIRRLEENAQKFYTIFHMSSAGLIISDVNTGTFLEVNQSFAELTGYTQQEVQGKTSSEIGLVTPEDRTRNMGLMNTEGYLENQETYYYTKSGEKRPSLMSVDLIDLGDKKIFLTILYDITQLKKTEHELIAAKVVAEASSLAKELFLANMSHEIRTPMNAIVGFTNLLEQTALDADQSQYLGYIKTSGENLLVLINDILDYSKIEAGMMVLEDIPFNLTDLLQSTRMMFSAKAEEKGIRLVVEGAPAIPGLLIGDPTRLTQILVNLVGNAIKFTNAGSVEVAVSLHSQTASHVHLQIVVRDTGIGIPAVKQREIFERFTQASSETTRNFGGTGLGLSIVKSLIELQQGEINLTSSEGKGTTFTIRLPYRIGEAPTEQQTATEVAVLVPFEKSLNILLVEDNGINQVLAHKILTGFGCRVDIAENGQIAVDSVHSHPYDLLLMDIQMPVMDGYTASKTIRYELKSAVPIIAMTANALPGEREKCLSFGMTDYIAKPFNVGALYTLIAKYTA